MIVLSVAYPFAAVGPDPVGGAEQILASIDGRLVRDGHGSIVLAAAGSRVAGHAVTIPEHHGWIDPDTRAVAHEAYRRLIVELCDRHAIEVVHYHGCDYLEYAPALDIPQIATLHVPRPLYPVDPATAPQIARVCVSHAQRRLLEDLEVADVIENGIAVERYRPVDHKSDFVLALGRICPEKGFEIALAAARHAGLPLVLAGGVFPYETHYRYATEVIEPLLDADRRFIGPVFGAHKRQLLAEARCVVIASQLDETSSLVAMEALASGTPVVALACGALPEIVEHERTGFIVADVAALPDALRRAGELSAKTCREQAVARFSDTRMTSRYLELFHRFARERPGRRTSTSIAIATADRELAGLAEEWDGLCDRCPDATAFQRPAWLLAWRHWFGRGGEPRVAIIRRDTRLVGLVPLELRGRSLRLIGEGITDYLDAIAEPDVEASLLRDAIEYAAQGARSLELSALRPSSRLRGLALGGRFADGAPSIVVSLDSARIPRRLAYDARRVERMSPLWFDEADNASALLEGLFALHRARWFARGEHGVLADAALEGFHREVVGAMARRRLVRLHGVAIDGELRGVFYGFADHGRFLFYLSGFDPQVARLSPGRLLIARAIERARDEGAFELDFLRGREPYKYEWGAIDRPAAIYRADLGRELRAGNSMDHR